ncbi:hypothetical protein AAKU64_001606 [Undibacterium sp. GrIS 1.8]
MDSLNIPLPSNSTLLLIKLIPDVRECIAGQHSKPKDPRRLDKALSTKHLGKIKKTKDKL